MEIHIIDSGANPGGVGEPSLPLVVPTYTLGNVIFAATGVKVRKLPLDLENIV